MIQFDWYFSKGLKLNHQLVETLASTIRKHFSGISGLIHYKVERQNLGTNLEEHLSGRNEEHIWLFRVYGGSYYPLT